MPADHSISLLLQRYLDDQLTPSEYEELLRWLRQYPENDTWAEWVSELGVEQQAELGYRWDRWQPIVEAILNKGENLSATEPESVIIRHISHRFWSRSRITAAAAILVIVIGGAVTWRILGTKQFETTPTVAKLTKDIAPGGNKATLTLSSGQRIVLDSAANGTLIQQGSTTVMKQNGQLDYKDGSQTANSGKDLVFNTLSTPRGGQYQLTLPDGTKVWLNAVSSITYPTAFTGSDRKVRISGEAYFEVAKDPGKPFTVQIDKDAEVQVLGTNFNINAYPDEPDMATTLLDGRIRFLANSEDREHPVVELKPGQQVQLSKSDDVRLLNHADIDQVMAWKNDEISFTNADFSSLMRQISRWYDVDIRYAGAVPQKHFFGLLSRNVYLSTILEYFQGNGIRIKQEGKVITVLP